MVEQHVVWPLMVEPRCCTSFFVATSHSRKRLALSNASLLSQCHGSSGLYARPERDSEVLGGKGLDVVGSSVFPDCTAKLQLPYKRNYLTSVAVQAYPDSLQWFLGLIGNTQKYRQLLIVRQDASSSSLSLKIFRRLPPELRFHSLSRGCSSSERPS